MIIKYEKRQGKCLICKIAFRWPIKLMRLKDAYCPRCGDKLVSTNHLLRWSWFEENPLNSTESYKLKRKRI